MVNTIAKFRAKGKNFEIVVDLDSALKLKKNQASINEAVISEEVFYDHKKGLRASEKDLVEFFGSSDFYSVAEKIIKSGEVQTSQDYRDEQKETKIKQVVDFLSKNALNPSNGKPHTPERIRQALEQAGVNIENKPIEEQMGKIVEKIKEIIPIKFETKKIKIKLSSAHAGKAYSIIKDYKEKEKWLDDGSLEVIINLPVGMQMDFYDKLNAITHGASIVEEIK